MVLEDYLAEQRYQESLDDGRSIQPRPSSPMSTLSKFGHWIRLLPNLYNLSQPRDHLRHLLKHCSPDVQVKSFSVNIEGMDLEPGSVEKAIVDMTLPRVGYLLVDVNQTPPSSSVAKLMDLLDQPSIVLKKLELGVKQSSTRMRYVEGKLMEMVPQTCVSLRELVLHKYNDDADSEAFWSSLFQRCGRVEKLRVDECLGSAQRLAQDMLAYMPNLREISFGRGVRARPMPDGASATLLSGSCNGWKVARLQSNFSGDTIDALSKHSSTLEWLDFGGCSHSRTLSIHLGQLLSSCTNLHTQHGHLRIIATRPIVHISISRRSSIWILTQGRPSHGNAKLLSRNSRSLSVVSQDQIWIDRRLLKRRTLVKDARFRAKYTIDLHDSPTWKPCG